MAVKKVKKIEEAKREPHEKESPVAFSIDELVDEYVEAKAAYDNLMEKSKTVTRFNALKEQILEFVDNHYDDADTAELKGSDKTLTVTAKGKKLELKDESRGDFMRTIGKDTFVKYFTFPLTQARKVLSAVQIEQFYESTGLRARSIRIKKNKD